MPSITSLFTRASSTTQIPAKDYSALIGKVFEMYTTRDPQVQRTIIDGYYSPMVTFEDPLMIVHGEKNFRVQFVSLIKFFSNITMEYSTTANDGAKPFKVIDPGSSGADSVDLVVPNRQIYRFARDGWLARKTLPEVVDLQVTTVLTVSKTSGLIEKHVDTWQGKHDNWLYARIGKPTVGRATSMWFRLLGW